MKILIVAASFVLLTACGDNFVRVQEADTIDAYEEYLTNNPSGGHQLEATIRLEELYLEKAREEKTLEAYDLYLEKNPEGVHREKAVEERETFLFKWAKKADTVEAWEKYLDEYGTSGTKKMRRSARSALAFAGYRQNVEMVGEPEMEQINLAEDPKGPKNGWKFTAEVKNTGDKTLESLDLTLRYLGEDGEVLDEKRWPAAAPRFSTPVEEWRKKPVKPGETRQWEYWTGDTPEGWSEKVEIVPTGVSFVD